MKHLLKPLGEKTKVKEKYLKFNVAKRFMLKGILSSGNLSIFTEDIFQVTLLHSDLLCDIFTL